MRKLIAQKYMRNINDNAVQGRLSKNYLTQNKTVWTQNVHDLWYITIIIIMLDKRTTMFLFDQPHLQVHVWYRHSKLIMYNIMLVEAVIINTLTGCCEGH